MSWRINLAHTLLRIGAYIQSSAIMVMKPDDLVEFSRQTYAKSHNVRAWTEDALVDSGLDSDEIALLSAIPEKRGKLLLLGMGGGREAISFSRMGFEVTGVDYIPAMVEQAGENASRHGVRIEGLVQEISDLDVPAEAFDFVWLSKDMYSCVPTSSRRIGMVRRIAAALKPGGLLLCQIRWIPEPPPGGFGMIFRRFLALVTLGNLAYQAGDKLWLNVEFVHFFSSEEDIRSEIEAGGLSIIDIHTSPSHVRGSVISKKPVRAEIKENPQI